jgi:hypothetical protein
LSVAPRLIRFLENRHCSICGHEMGESSRIGQSQNPACQHYFHLECIVNHLLYSILHIQCPDCDRNLVSADGSPEGFGDLANGGDTEHVISSSSEEEEDDDDDRYHDSIETDVTHADIVRGALANLPPDNFLLSHLRRANITKVMNIGVSEKIGATSQPKASYFS